MHTDAIPKMKNLKTKKLYLQVYDELREYIINNKLQPGDKLPTEMAMCELLGVSRNVLREAIKALEISGLVCSTPGVGIVIQPFSTDFLFQSLLYHLAGDNNELLQKQALEVRRILELGYVEEAFASITPEDVDALDALAQEMRRIVEKNMKGVKSSGVFGQRFHEADSEFHHRLYQNTGNNILCSMVEAVWDFDRYCLKKTPAPYMMETVEKHERIVAALRSGDSEQFRAAMQLHFNRYKTTHADVAEGDIP